MDFCVSVAFARDGPLLLAERRESGRPRLQRARSAYKYAYGLCRCFWVSQSRSSRLQGGCAGRATEREPKEERSEQSRKLRYLDGASTIAFCAQERHRNSGSKSRTLCAGGSLGGARHPRATAPGDPAGSEEGPKRHLRRGGGAAAARCVQVLSASALLG